jgi:hypothetical protein
MRDVRRPLIVAFGVICFPAGAHTQRPALDVLYDAVAQDTAAEQSERNGCLRLHHIWKRQVSSSQRTTGLAADAQVDDMVKSVYRPYVSFMSGYVGDENAFRRGASSRGKFDPDADARILVPAQLDIGPLMLRTLDRMEAFTGRRACGEWYLLYGPGYANLGGLSTGGMFIDFFGLPRSRPAENLRLTLPHEYNHLIFAAGHRNDPDSRTLLYRMINEGFATYIADQYWGDSLTTADALGYTAAELDSARVREAQIWEMARPVFASTERAVNDRWFSARTRLQPGLPGKIGYFLGYQVAAAYVKKHGEGSWKRLFDLPVAEILRESGLGK